MRLSDRWPRGRDGVVLAVATGAIVALLGSAAAVRIGDDGGEGGAASATPARSDDPLVRVVSRAGGFSVDASAALVGDRAGRGVKLSTETGDLVMTIAATGQAGLGAGHATALRAIRRTYPEVRVDGEVRTSLGGLTARRSVGVVRRDRGDQVIFSVTTAAQERRTWSVVMFAARDIAAARLERFYQPVLDGFRLLHRRQGR